MSAHGLQSSTGRSVCNRHLAPHCLVNRIRTHRTASKGCTSAAAPHAAAYNDINGQLRNSTKRSQRLYAPRCSRSREHIKCTAKRQSESAEKQAIVAQQQPGKRDRKYSLLTGFPFPLGPFSERKTIRSEVRILLRVCMHYACCLGRCTRSMLHPCDDVCTYQVVHIGGAVDARHVGL